MVMQQVHQRAESAGKRAAPLELFYDLVFVFALSQISHLLLANLSWAGAGQAVVILLAVWWSWNYTTWSVNELDSETDRVRILLIALMLASLLMAVAAPEAFGSKGLLFAGAYVSIQVGRHLFLTFVVAAKGTIERERSGRILIWFIAGGVFWVAGGLAEGTTRVVLWLMALALDYAAPLVLFRIPGRPRLVSETWELATEHFTERFGLFVIAALGETVVITSATVTDLDLDATTMAAFSAAFIGTAALWWLYFTSARELARHALSESPTRTKVARDSYTYVHVFIVAGIILTAVGDELILTAPTAYLSSAQIVAVAGGPTLYLLAQAALRLRVTRRINRIVITGAIACVIVGYVGTWLPALAVSALLLTILLVVVVAEEVKPTETGDTPLEGRERCSATDSTIAVAPSRVSVE